MPLDRDATLKTADKLLKKGDLAGAIEAYAQLVEDRPSDWNSANTLGDLYVKAGDAERAAALFTRGADHLYGEGFFPRASAVYKKVLKVKSDDDHSIWQLADIAGRNGLLLDARSYYARLIRDRRARHDERGAVDCLVRLARLEDADVDAKVVAARALVPFGESKQAARLMLSAADDLIKHDRPAEALAMLTEAAQLDPADPEIRDRLAATGAAEVQAPETTATAGFEIVSAGPVEEVPVSQSATPVIEAGLDSQAAIPRAAEEGTCGGEAERGVELAVLMSDAAETAGIRDDAPIVLEAVREDLGDVLAELEAMPGPAPEAPRDLEAIFEELRARVADEQDARSRQQFDRGLHHLAEGRVAEAVANLEEAARIPTMRFEASAQLARVLTAQGDLQAAVEWMERASEAPPPTPEEGLALLYELADALTELGETARSLAVLIEIDTDSAGYRDVRDRIAQLSAARAGSSGT